MNLRPIRCLVAVLSILAPACGSAGEPGEGESVESAISPPQATISFSATSYAFGTVNDGQTASTTVTATTVRALPVFSITGTNAADFKIASSTCTVNVGSGGQNCSITVEFAPLSSATGSLSAALSATSSTGAKASVALSGTAAPPSCELGWTLCYSCPTSASCTATCVSTLNDVHNCGGCGVACSANQKCETGACE